MSVTTGPSLWLALATLLVIALLAQRVGRLPLGRASVTAALRAAVQLAIAAACIALAVRSLWLSALLVAVMLAMAVVTTSGRTSTRRAWPWVLLALASGAVPTIAVILATGAVPLLQGIALIPIAGIIIGSTMTAHTLYGRLCFATLAEQQSQYQAYLALGLLPSEAIDEVLDRRPAEALVPNLDQTRTTGVVTLPGAFIGVMLGGGSPVQAGAAQLLVLLGIMASQALTVTTAKALTLHRRLLPEDLRIALHD